MRFVLALFISIMSSQVRANDACADLWFTRNLIMDRAGYCFDSLLGQTLFDNSDCIGKHIALDPVSQQRVNEIRRIEAEKSCYVNTAQTWIDLPDINYRRVMTDLPLRDEFGFGCLGWTGPQTQLYTGTAATHYIGQITPGDYVLYYHYGLQGWSYVTVHTYNFQTLKSAGWLNWSGRPPCQREAG